jgi:hypothetical protein
MKDFPLDELVLLLEVLDRLSFTPDLDAAVIASGKTPKDYREARHKVMGVVEDIRGSGT